MQIRLPDDWYNHLKNELNKPYIHELEQFLTKEYQERQIFPKEENIFAALEATPYSKVKVVILGQDPYHGENQAHGLSFSVNDDQKLPPSLRNMFQELTDDLGIKKQNGNLMSWAKQGVLLLNTVLTVRAGKANSHKKKGWEELTDTIIKELNKRKDPVIFVLWGKPAQTKLSLINTNNHYVITAPHPSPLSSYRGFFGSKPFSKINQLLEKQNKTTIDW